MTVLKKKNRTMGPTMSQLFFFFGLSADIIVIATYTTLKFIFNNMND